MSDSPAPADEYQQGLVNRRRVLGDAWVDKSLANRNDFNAEFQELITRHAWNDIWGRPALGDKTRRYMVLSMMLGIHAYEEFAMHVRAALDGPPESRLTPADIKEVIMMAAIYRGVPVANHAFGIATGILREKGLLATPGGVSRRAAIPFVWLLPLLLAAQPVATDSYLPALPAIAQELGSASLSLTVFVLAFGIGQLPCGPLSDRFGRRPVMLTGLACYAVAALACALAPSIAWLAAGRALQGFSMAAILVCARAAVRDLYPAHEGPHVMARGLTGLGVVGLVAPLLGAFTVQHGGWRWVLAGMALYAAVLWWLCWRNFHETRAVASPSSSAGDAPPAGGSVRAVFASQSFRAWASLAATTYGGLFCFLLLSPLVYISYLGLSPTLYGLIPAGGSLVYIGSTTLCRRLLRRLGPVRTVRIGALLSLSGACIQALGCWLAPTSAWPLLLGHAVYVSGHGIHQPCGQAGAVGDLPHLAGRAVSWSGFGMMAVAFVVGQIAASFVDPAFTHGAWPMVVPMVVAGVAIMGIAWLWLPRIHSSFKKETR